MLLYGGEIWTLGWKSDMILDKKRMLRRINGVTVSDKGMRDDIRRYLEKERKR